MKNKGFGVESLRTLTAQLLLYRAGSSPYNSAAGGEAWSCRSWWKSICTHNSKILVHLAILLLDIVPHAAEPERLFSLLKWFNSATRVNISVETLAMMATIKTHYQQQLPRQQRNVVRQPKEDVAEVRYMHASSHFSLSLC
jgi:hypothetical protein